MEVASPTVNEALEEFLAEQGKELEPEEHRALEMVIGSIPGALDQYAYEHLSDEERAFWERRWDEDEEANSFSNTFGPEKIVGFLELFLNWYLIRKVMGPPEMIDRAGWAVGRLVDWLEARGHVDAPRAQEAGELAAGAADDLPRMERLGELLYGQAEERLDEPVIEHQDWEGVMAEIVRVEPRRLWFRPEDEDRDYGPVHVPLAASDLAEAGWKVSALHLGRTERTWRVLEIGNVYPP